MKIKWPFWCVVISAALLLIAYGGEWFFGPRKEEPGGGVLWLHNISCLLFVLSLLLFPISLVLWILLGNKALGYRKRFRKATSDSRNETQSAQQDD